MLNNSYNESYNIVRLDNLQTLVLERGLQHKCSGMPDSNCSA